jgi:hypothetical protein
LNTDTLYLKLQKQRTPHTKGKKTAKADMPKGYEGRGIVGRSGLEHPEKFIICT